MCECIDSINQKLASRNLNTKIKEPFFLGKDLSISARKVMVVTEKADSSTRKRPTTITANYCPFCGIKY